MRHELSAFLRSRLTANTALDGVPSSGAGRFDGHTYPLPAQRLLEHPGLDARHAHVYNVRHRTRRAVDAHAGALLQLCAQGIVQRLHMGAALGLFIQRKGQRRLQSRGKAQGGGCPLR